MSTPSTTSSAPLIAMSEITKVFYTDEVETHALSGVHFDLQRGEYVSISGPSGWGPARSTPCSRWAS